MSRPDATTGHAVPKPGILVVEDEAAVRSMLQAGLEQYGFAVWSAATGEEALRLYDCHREAIRVALLDVRMPGLDGPQTLQALRQLNPALGCCFMSGDTGVYTEEDLLALGARCLFRKPFSLGETARALHDLADPG